MMAKQLLHLVFGGELTALDKVEFRNLEKVHFVGLYPSFAKAREAWKAAAQATVDNAHMRYFVVHLHRLLQPEALPEKASAKPVAKRKRQTSQVKTLGKRGNQGKRQ
jgi:protein-disulfide isomerase